MSDETNFVRLMKQMSVNVRRIFCISFEIKSLSNYFEDFFLKLDKNKFSDFFLKI